MDTTADLFDLAESLEDELQRQLAVWWLTHHLLFADDAGPITLLGPPRG